jgi:Protein of unknown function (DUF3313)
MKRSMSVRRLAVMVGLCLGFNVAAVTVLAAKDAPPQVSDDGLNLVKQTKTRLVYKKPDATFTQFKRVAILDCAVEFSKSWLKDYNNSTRDLSRRIGDDDLARAKTSLSAAFKKIFTEELATKGGYQISETAAPDVLVLRPALVNIQVSAPDLMTPGRSVTFVQESGQMTLYLELWDSSNNTILGRVMDARSSNESYGQRSSSVSNKAAADRIMRSWAKELRERLDVITGKGEAPAS